MDPTEYQIFASYFDLQNFFNQKNKICFVSKCAIGVKLADCYCRNRKFVCLLNSPNMTSWQRWRDRAMKVVHRRVRATMVKIFLLIIDSCYGGSLELVEPQKLGVSGQVELALRDVVLRCQSQGRAALALSRRRPVALVLRLLQTIRPVVMLVVTPDLQVSHPGVITVSAVTLHCCTFICTLVSNTGRPHVASRLTQNLYPSGLFQFLCFCKVDRSASAETKESPIQIYCTHDINSPTLFSLAKFSFRTAHVIGSMRCTRLFPQLITPPLLNSTRISFLQFMNELKIKLKFQVANWPRSMFFT